MTVTNTKVIHFSDIEPDIIHYLRNEGFTATRIDDRKSLTKEYNISNTHKSAGGLITFHSDDRIDFSLWREGEGGKHKVTTLGKPQDPSTQRFKIEQKIYMFLTADIYHQKRA